MTRKFGDMKGNDEAWNVVVEVEVEVVNSWGDDLDEVLRFFLAWTKLDFGWLQTPPTYLEQNVELIRW